MDGVGRSEVFENVVFREQIINKSPGGRSKVLSEGGRGVAWLHMWLVGRAQGPFFPGTVCPPHMSDVRPVTCQLSLGLAQSVP